MLPGPCDARQIPSSWHRSCQPSSASGLKSHLDAAVPRQKQGLGVTLPKGREPFSLGSRRVEGRAKEVWGLPGRAAAPRSQGGPDLPRSLEAWPSDSWQRLPVCLGASTSDHRS